MSIYDVFSGGNRPFDKAEWAAQKQAQRNEAYELIDTTCTEMAANGDAFRQYLDVQGRFDRYSVNNAILVSAQKPFRTLIAVVFILALPFWYSIATSKIATTTPTTNNAHPNKVKSRMVACTQSSSKMSAPILPIMAKKSATAPYIVS